MHIKCIYLEDKKNVPVYAANNLHFIATLLEPRVLVTPVSVPSVKMSVGTAIYLGMKILSSTVEVKNPVPSKFAWHT